MGKIRRSNPLYSMCGLNCGLCPMYHISEKEHCPGCGGEGKSACGIMRCGQTHGGVEYCFQCGAYPCERYDNVSEQDSFVPYQNVLRDFERARRGGLEAYQAVLEEKVELLRWLLANCNDGRRKSLFCTAVNLLELEDVRAVVSRLREEGLEAPLKERGARAAALLQEKAAERDISLKLRKKKETDRAHRL